MPPKRLSENPPPAVSSDEEEEESESESGTESEPEPQNPEQKGAVNKKNGEKDDNDANDDDKDDGDAEDDEEDDDEEEKVLSRPVKKSVATSQKSDSATESDDSESTQPSPPISAFTIKHHKRSPKPGSKPGSKRPAESDSTVSATTTSKKNKTSTTATVDNAKKNAKKNDDDKSTIGVGVTLGLLASQSANPSSAKKPVRASISKSKDTETPKKGRASKDKEKVQVKRMILKTEEKSVNGKENTQDKEIKEEIKSEEFDSDEDDFDEDDFDEDDLWVKYPLLSQSLEIEMLPQGATKMLREQLGMIEEEKLKGLNDRWRILKEAELQLFVQRMELLQDQVKLAVDAINSGGS